MVPLNNGNAPFNAQPKKKRTPKNDVHTSTGLRPRASEIPDTTKLPTVAEIPSVPISQLIVVGSKPRTLVRKSGVNVQQITRYDTKRMAISPQRIMLR